ncbi:MAG TPA: phosphatase PAP2 family protein [Vicinamibacterales bacterium]|nr:phosphatase PAP2 family protein [Vicinamibacterales bacterium]
MRAVDFARWTTTLTTSYLVVTAILLEMSGQSIPHRHWLVAAHVVLAFALLLLRTPPPSTALRLVRDWHPIVLFPFLFKEVEPLAAAIGNWRMTSTIVALEAMLFGGQPSLYLSQQLAFVPLSEFLHFCYLAYVIVIPAVAGYWYICNRRAFSELLLMLSVVMLGSYLFFILLPVDSPYYLSARLAPPLSDHFFFGLVHQVSARGGARGGAFPSAHVSGALVVFLVAWRHQRRLACLLSPIIAGVVMATVYGRFHYALDTVAGLLLAVVVVFSCRRLVDRKSREPRLSLAS